MSKKKLDSFQLCELCGRLVYSRQLADHRAVCGADSSSEDHKCAFIQDGVLHALAVERNNKMISDSKLPLPSRKNVILLNSNTMRECNLPIGKRVVLRSDQKNLEIVCMAWPSSGVSPECVALSQLSLENLQVSGGEFVSIRALKKLWLHAARVELELCDAVEFEVNQLFTDYCLQDLRNQYVYPGHKLEVTFYGRARQLMVIGLTGSCTLDTNSISPAEFKPQQIFSNTSTSKLTDKLERLSLKRGTRMDAKAAMSCDVEDLTIRRNLSSNYQKQNYTEDELVDVESKEKSEGSVQQSYHAKAKIEHGCGNTLRSDVQPNQRDGPSVFYYISPEETHLTIHARGVRQSEHSVLKNKVTFKSIGGLHKQVALVREMIELPLKHPEMFTNYGIPPPRGVLLHGPSGTGKTLIAQAVAAESGAHFICLNGPDVLSRYYGETEARLRDIFREARERAPAIVFIDELDALCPKRDKVQNEFEKRVVATLLTLMDGADTANFSSSHVIFLAATNRPDAIDPALRRPGRLDREIEIGIPNANDREDILRTLLLNVPHGCTEDDLRSFAELAHGYVGADLTAVCKEAGLMSFKRCLAEQNGLSTDDVGVQEEYLKERLLVTREDIMAAFRQVRPSAMREVSIDVPKVRWEDIGGNAVIKQKLKQAVEWPLKHPEAFQRLGIRPPKGILMYGPPGCSKTLVARALATESGLNFLAVKGPELFSKWVGESEKAVRQVFQKARAAAPSIVFFDEIDALAARRGSGGDDGGSSVSDRVLTQLLTELDGVETLKDVVMVAATNCPDMIDKALLRPGRIDRIVYVPLPDKNAREEIFKIHLNDTPLGDDVVMGDLAENTEMFSGAEITALCREAALMALQEDIESNEVLRRHFDEAFRAVKPRTSRELIEMYRKYQNESGVHSI
ncbi:ATPase family gene 2 protein homolog A isoform X1 [Pocillopora verrucosa]|uniref:ATPase family gene 2 protein homolog A isoform X1 n=1 Tax=Pocillopora verrucosa TaxID=203993 RepID=UPI0033405D87